MKHALPLFTALLFAPLAVLHAAESSAQSKPVPDPAMTPIEDVAGLPRVLLIGDSVSIGYTLPTREMLKGKANVHRPPTNCSSTGNGLNYLKSWLGDKKWDVIHFNCGLHDAKLPPEGVRHAPPEVYEKNLRELVIQMKATGAKLIFATTTPVPNGGNLRPTRRFGSVDQYNAVAREVMTENGVTINDLNAAIAPHVEQMQRVNDVHFTDEGSALLAKQVVKAIETHLGIDPHTSASPKAARLPNVIFILADDLAQGDLGCYGQKLIKTPNLDRMAAEGTRFTQAYSGTSVCAPSRTSLMTGLHMGHAPIRSNRLFEVENSPFGKGERPLPPSTLTVAQLLKQQGYSTACMGKWGMGQFDTSGSPLKVGFDHFYGYNSQIHAHNYFPTYLFNDDRRVELPENEGDARATYAQNLIQKDVLKWVSGQREQPFFLFYAVTLPHGHHDIDDLGDYANRDGWTPLQKAYAAMVTRLDSDIGQLLALLKEMSEDENTVVLVAGDNGSSFSNNSEVGAFFDQTMGGKLRGHKRSMYEGGLRQAALARWPGVVPAARVSNEPWAFWDFLPTAAELAGAKLSADYSTDGQSLVAFLKGGPAPQREYFYWELHEGSTGSIQGIRFGDWKAVKNFTDVPTELFDLSKDSGETNNLAEQHPELVNKAEELMASARIDTADFPWRMRSLAKTKAAKAKKKNDTPKAK